MTAHVSARHILLADDDRDDGLLFGDILAELSVPVQLTIFHGGEKFVRLLKTMQQLPNVLFLDLNMPLKNGLSCLIEIKQTGVMQQLPVIIFTTAYELSIVNHLYASGAHYYIRKPNDFVSLKNVIDQAIKLTNDRKNLQPPRDQFELSPLTA